ncbi:response regulator transcription factor [Priestia megaterium]|jgi:DNA-binding NarL/FixJ family response regulator|uniref:Response regulator transcription factor n=1 Tax=Priestia aryabhattai TaxID=412384 RepID=A0AAX6N7E5_PRIAR|nr:MULTISPECIES: response regulator transcription factor [Priestia]KOP75361.1 chemotaxis protein CheY [Bacillus sp. FJAT-21351]KQU16704.1 two-component system response regulator [Bacillus sp. Leaf75]MBZ5481643.1 response regulator transcription factor [Bacillus sp. T_4]MDH6653752.1 DNA-binding NarL/FixJ family response regulator [Bacillus sp. PvP124]RFB26530.1 DNA-binding response regulator [Bacillus sp. ALD]RFB36180.1 DNA-binding response regulator [Bacillus sp. RC]
MQPFRILIVDDHAHAREGIRDILEEYEDFIIVGEGTNGQEAIELTEKLMPDIVLMDIGMPVMDGLEATKQIKLRFPYVKIVVITVSDDITDLFDALKKGAQGYLLKNLQSEVWYDYLRAFALDEVPMSKEIAFQILKEFPQETSITKPDTPLSARELEVLQLVAKGLSNRDISAQLFISEHTVKSHLKNILSKLHLENRVQLTSYAFQNGLMN